MGFDALTLIDVALCYLLGVVISRGYVYYEAFSIFDRFQKVGAKQELVTATTRAVPPNAVRLGLIGMSAFMSLKFGTLYLSSQIGVNEAEAINFWSSIFIAILALSSSFANTRSPHLARLWVTRNESRIVEEVFWIYRNAILIFVSLSGLVLALMLFSSKTIVFAVPSLGFPGFLPYS